MQLVFKHLIYIYIYDKILFFNNITNHEIIDLFLYKSLRFYD